MRFPHDKKFALTIIDDTDLATVDNITPIYRLLEDLGMRITKTVWPLSFTRGPSTFSTSQTLEDPGYRRFVVDLQRRGFEIAFHGATMESSTRERTQTALELFHETFGSYPRVHANHAYNRENIYWGTARFDESLVRLLYRVYNRKASGYYAGHIESSAYWWGDLCAQHITYVRNFRFGEINLARVNPSMPYRDPKRPFVRLWFSSTQAEDAREFNQLLAEREQERLEREGGFCIIATHLGREYVRDGRVDPVTRRLLESLAHRPGWFPTVSELLDWLLKERGSKLLPEREWRAMQWKWARDQLLRRWQRRNLPSSKL